MTTGPQRILERADARHLTMVRDKSVHTAVTSPPFWGLRSYGTEPGIWDGDQSCAHEWGAMERGKRKDVLPADVTTATSRMGVDDRQDVVATNGGNFCTKCGAWRGEFGSEPTPDLYVAHMVQVCSEVHRVLRDDGTFWLNLGDSYASVGKWGGKSGGKHVSELHGDSGIGRGKRDYGSLKPKDLVGIPWRVAFALQAAGWYLRDCIIWAKPNPMPSSVTDRTTTAHEYIFLLTKSARYFYDADAIREPVTSTGGASVGKQKIDATGTGAQSRKFDSPAERNHPLGRNKRSVWKIPTFAYPGAHFATFPPRLIEPCIKAGTSEKGCCPHCGAQWKRIVERIETGWDGSKYGESALSAAGGAKSGGTAKSTLGSPHGTLVASRVTINWLPGCKCPTHEPIPSTVGDSFNGAGTTGLVCKRLGRSYIGTDLNPGYLKLARDRIDNDPGEKPEKVRRPKRVPVEAGLFGGAA